MTNRFEFIPNAFNSGNHVARGEGFFISYVENCGSGISMFAADNDGDETALVHNGKYYILNGDWRSEYAPLIDKGFDALPRAV